MKLRMHFLVNDHTKRGHIVRAHRLGFGHNTFCTRGTSKCKSEDVIMELVEFACSFP